LRDDLQHFSSEAGQPISTPSGFAGRLSANQQEAEVLIS
jgi:hypothetical protein